MKKLLLFIILLLIPFNTILAAEKTLSQWTTELNKKQRELNDNASKKSQTQAQINAANAQITSIYNQIEEANKEIEKKTKESKQLEIDIEKKTEESKEIMRYYQISSSGSALIEYVLSAESITDFIYRVSITKQITEYNNKMVKEMNEMISENTKVQTELNDKKKELANLKTDINNKIAKLNEQKSDLNDEGHSLSQSIKEMQNTISYLKKLGCKDSETQTSCLNRIYSNKYLPSGTTFFRPTSTGRISSNYGWRTLYGKPNLHAAIDIAMPTGTTVYAVATGRVAKIIKSASGGGNQLIIHHNINGTYYTSYYAHLNSFNVSVGTLVTKDTVVAKSGNTGNSTGPHLHLGIAKGRWYQDYYAYYGDSGFVGKSIDPRNVIIFPAKGKSYSNR